ncbi:MAG TPA: hypothetical protein OIM50_06010 [Clostridiaceae bacterium]|jgi:hypothetical protein|nr:hypothetical protein [Clostridia bacterium]HJJ09827.1 hypothetical protein [Clostridiaceae bacterium]
MLDEDYANIVHTLLDFAKRNILDFKQKDNFFKVVMSLKEKTQKQKERFIMFYNLDKNNNEEYTLSKLAKYNNCTSSAVKFSITSVASKLANLKDDRKYILVQIYEQCIAKQNN